VVHVLSTYAMAVDRYELFCAKGGLDPWPTEGIQVVAWLLDLVDTVKPASMQMYGGGLHPGACSITRHFSTCRGPCSAIMRLSAARCATCTSSAAFLLLAGGVEKTTVIMSVGVQCSRLRSLFSPDDRLSPPCLTTTGPLLRPRSS
jgi:hypothetical protein